MIFEILHSIFPSLRSLIIDTIKGTIIGIIIGYFVLPKLLKKYKFSFPPNESQQVIEKREKLVSIYITIFAVLAAIKGMSNLDALTLAVYFLFFSTIIFYLMYIGTNQNRRLTYCCGIIAASAFSSVLVYSTVPFPPTGQFVYFILLTLIIGWSLVGKFDKRKVNVDVEDE